jgi:adenosylhomocysteine nucleosidase
VSGAATDARPVVAVTGLAIEARIAAGDGVRTIAAGGDRWRLEDSLEREFAHGATAIISIGIAGGLVATMKPGRWVVADAVVTRSSRWPVDAAWARALAERLPAAVRGTLVGMDNIVATSADKHALGQATDAIAVDTESHVVAAFAGRHGIPFAVFRVIADPVGCAIAPAATLGMRNDGSVNARAVLGSVARAPRQLPALLRNAVDAQIAFRALSRGRRLLGPRLGYPDLGQFRLDVP